MLVAGAALIAAPFAAAIPTVYYDIGAAGTDFSVFDNEALKDMQPLAGAISSSFTSGGFTALTTAATKPALGSPTVPSLANSQLQLSGTGTITFYFAESGFGPSSTRFLAELAVISLAPTATVSYFTYATMGALESSPGVLILGLGAPMTTQVLGGLGANQANGVLPFAGTGPYNLIQKVVINQPTGGSTQISANLTSSVPDGGTTLALLGASLLGMGAVRRKLTK